MAFGFSVTLVELIGAVTRVPIELGDDRGFTVQFATTIMYIVQMGIRHYTSPCKVDVEVCYFSIFKIGIFWFSAYFNLPGYSLQYRFSIQ